MQAKDSRSSGAPINVEDIVYALFKHKWMIIILSVLGLGVAALLYKTSKPQYESRSKLMVKYLVERGGVDPYSNEVDAGGRSGGGLVETEVEILTSGDTARSVVRSMGIERIVKGGKAEATESAAVGVILSGLSAKVAKGSNVIQVSYRHASPQEGANILGELIDSYFIRHLDLHRSKNAYDYVSSKTDQLRTELADTDKSLSTLLSSLGVHSLSGAMAASEVQENETRLKLNQCFADLAEQEVRVAALRKALQQEEEAGGAAEAEGVAVIEPAADPSTVVEFQVVQEQLTFLRQQLRELSARWGPRNPQVARTKTEIAQNEAKEALLLTKYPDLVGWAQAGAGGGNAPQSGLTMAMLIDEESKLLALKARIKTYQEQDMVRSEQLDRLIKARPEIERLERVRVVKDENLRHFAAALEKAKIDETLNPSAMPNISIIESPSAPSRVFSETMKKLTLAAAASGILLGVGLALLLELVLDRRVKRPAELETRLRIPLMMSIPRIGKADRAKGLVHRPLHAIEASVGAASAESDGHRANGVNGTSKDALPGNTGDAEAVVQPEHFIAPYAEAIRDRLGYYFELNNLTHTPKLIALAALKSGAGTSTLAVGLARAIAEESAKVLLVDMSGALKRGDQEDSPHPAIIDELQSEEDLNIDTVGDNFFVATMSSRRDGRAGKRFAARQFYELMPKFRSSEFDYIIFDMPEVDSISPTTAMAGFMDQVLLVLDAEDTDRETLQRNYAELARGSADVTCIFNKTQSIGPRWARRL